MSKHTPGPWTVVPPFTYGNKDFCVESERSGHGRVVITGLGYDEGQQEANARLIAAAPDLAEAAFDCLKDIYSELECHGLISCDYEKLEAALEKAGLDLPKLKGRKKKKP